MDISKLSPEELASLEKQLAERKRNSKESYTQRKVSFEALRDKCVASVISDAKALQEMLQDFKYTALSVADELQGQVVELTESSRTNLNNFFLLHSDGVCKIEVSTTAKPVYDETFAKGIEYVEEWISEVIKESNKSVSAVVRRLLKTNKDGQYNPAKLLELIGLEDEIASPTFSKGVAIIKESFKNGESKRYIRFYHKTESGAMEHLTLQFSALEDLYEPHGYKGIEELNNEEGFGYEPKLVLG